MIIFAYLFIGLLIFSSLFLFVAIVIEKNFSETHPIKKWWRKHVVADYPYEDDNS